MTTSAPDHPLIEQAVEEPTPASVWRAVAGSPITDVLLEWPPDLFAFVDVVLEQHETRQCRR